jgi:hypothetical protein
MIELEERGLDTIVDKIIFTVPPHLGTPKGMASILHGSEQGLAKGMLTTEAQARELSLNMSSAYVLSPSKSLFDSGSSQFVISFDQTSELTRDLYGRYGSEIDSWTEYLQYLSGAEGRKIPEYNNLSTPSIVNVTLFNESVVDHQKLDNWESSNPDLEISTIAGVGFNTVRGWQYVEGSKWTLGGKKSFVYPKLIRTRAGDGTVVSDSIKSIGDRYYFDQYRFFELNNGTNASHAEFFRAPDVNECVSDLIIDSAEKCDSDFISDQVIYVDTDYYEIAVHSPIRILATELSSGLQTGQRLDGSIINDIPGSNYEIFAGSSYLDLVTTEGIKIEYFYDDSNELDYQSAIFEIYKHQPGQESELLLRTSPLVVDQSSHGIIEIIETEGSAVATVKATNESLLVDIDIFEEQSNGQNPGGGGLVIMTTKVNPGNSRLGVVEGVSTDRLQIRLQLIKRILNLDIPIELKRLLLKVIMTYE